MFCSFNGGPYQVNKVLTAWNTKLRFSLWRDSPLCFCSVKCFGNMLDLTEESISSELFPRLQNQVKGTCKLNTVYQFIVFGLTLAGSIRGGS